ncbi:MAG: D-alanyl-D-alanine carboxypeptidase [Ruminococcaceae bacterium]|nr:D-alanyl-D-alanine carboxypeptidase [Oscillospiraceae bacterium]
MGKSRILRRITAVFLFVALLMSVFSINSFADNENNILPFPSVSGADCIYLYNYESDRVVYSNVSNDREIIAPSATVKMMTGLLAIEMLDGRFDEQIKLTEELLSGVEGYTVRFEKDSVVTVKDLLYGLICGGGNDAAIVLARLCSGSVESFVSKMNDKAKEWGCAHTNYINPTGIDEVGMTTSLHDTVIISKKAVENSEFMKMCSAQFYKYKPINSDGEKTIANRNAMISSYSAVGYKNSKVKGLNSGMTDMGGYCVCAYATDGTDSYLCIVMGAVEISDGTILSYKIANTLLNYAFENYSYELIAKKGEKIGELGVDLALPTNGRDEMRVDCILSKDIYAYAPTGIGYRKELTYKPFYYEDRLTAPVLSGTEVGGVDIYYENILIATGKLVSKNDVQASELLISIDNMRKVLTSRTVIVFVILILSFSLGCFTVKKIKKNNKNKGRR